MFKKMLVELESLRGIAALFVVVFHIPKWHPVLDIGIINNAYLMVELFFVLSGYVIFTAYHDRLNCFYDVLKFQFLRFGRLYPVHVLFLLVFVGIEFAKFFAAQKMGIISPNSVPFGNNDLAAFVKNIFLVQAMLPYQNLTFNNPSWSISVEFYTYLFFAITVLLAGRFRVLVFAIVAAVSLMLLSSDMTFGMVALLRCLAGFLLGCLSAYVIDKYDFTLPKLSLPAACLALVAYLQFKAFGEHDTVVFALTVAIVFALVKTDDSVLKRALRMPVFLWIGKISYSIYMAHAAVIWVVIQSIRVVIKKPEVIGWNGKSVSQLSLLETGLAVCVIFASVLLLSYFVHRFVEMPFRAKSRAFVQADNPLSVRRE